eukprot:SM000040S14746  [mRNA]  locus=s40:62094:65916:- [translate_table: standard]
MDIYGSYGTKWSSLLHRLALHVDARQRSWAGSLGHSSVPQAIVACYSMRLSLSLRRSQALAIHQRAGRALAQANGFRGGSTLPREDLGSAAARVGLGATRHTPGGAVEQGKHYEPWAETRQQFRPVKLESSLAAACRCSRHRSLLRGLLRGVRGCAT